MRSHLLRTICRHPVIYYPMTIIVGGGMLSTYNIPPLVLYYSHRHRVVAPWERTLEVMEDDKVDDTGQAANVARWKALINDTELTAVI